MALKDTLQTLLEGARLTGREHEIRLSRGLVVNVLARRDGVRLTLRRRSGSPSLAEWRTVLNCWPEPTYRVDPETISDNGQTMLRGVIKPMEQTRMFETAAKDGERS